MSSDGLSGLSVRELGAPDVESIADYWAGSTPEYLTSLGVDLNKLPARVQMMQWLHSQLQMPLEQRGAYCLIWELDGQKIGHCNVNPIAFGDHAYMHLHLWNTTTRRRGLGTSLVKRSLPYFFENLKLQRLYSEPYALNPAPHPTLQRAGFEFVREYVTTPGSLNFEQRVKRWQLTHVRFRELVADPGAGG